MTTISAQAGATAMPLYPVAAKVTLVFAATFVTLLTVVHLLTPELDASMRPISEYALGPHGWLMTLAFLAWGASTASLVWTLRAHVRRLTGRIGLVFLLIGAAGPLLAAVFPMDPMATPGGRATVSGNIHNLAAMLGDGIPIGALLLTISLVRRNPSWRPARWPLVLTMVLSWIGVIVMTAMLAAHMSGSGGQFGPNSAIGWPARLMILAYVSWIVTAALFAVRIEAGARGGRR